MADGLTALALSEIGFAGEAVAITVHVVPIGRVPARNALAPGIARVTASRKMLICRSTFDEVVHSTAAWRIGRENVKRHAPELKATYLAPEIDKVSYPKLDLSPLYPERVVA